MRLLRGPVDETLTNLVEEAGRNVQRSGLLLRQLISELPEHEPLAEEPRRLRARGRSHHPRHHPPASPAIRRVRGGRALHFNAGDEATSSPPRSTTSSITPSRPARPARPVRRRSADGAGGRVRQRARRGWRADPRGVALSEHGRGPHTTPGRDSSSGRTRATAYAARRRRLQPFAQGTDPMVVIRWKDIFESPGGRRRRLRDGRPSARGGSS